MSEYIDLLIIDNDLVLDPARQPLLVNDRASIAQDIAHLIRESGLLVTLVAERDRMRQRDCIQQMELLVEADERLVPGTAQIKQVALGQYLVMATTVKFGSVEVSL
ncbi:phage protein [Pseudomonas putida]|nr:phage protein [Pseudomonas putida]